MVRVPFAIGTVDLEFTVDFPNVNLDCWLTSDGSVIPSARYHLGAVALSWDGVSLDIPTSLGLPVSGGIDFSIDRDRAEVVLSGRIAVPDYSYSVVAWFPYMNPFRLPSPDWTATLDPARFQAQINAIPADRYKADVGARSLDSSELTQDLMRGALTFAGAGGFLTQMNDAAQALKASFTRSALERGVSTFPGGDIVLALVFGGTAALMQGNSFAAGLFFETSGIYGTFGTVATDMGLIASLSAGIGFMVYWPVKDLNGNTIRALDCFSGYNIFEVGSVDAEILGLDVALYWPANAPWEPSSLHTCGFGVSVGPGIGLPFNYYTGNSNTVLTSEMGNYLSIDTILDRTGPTAGGVQVIAMGNGFNQQTMIAFGQNVGRDTNMQGNKMLRTITPRHDAGPVDVTVSNPDGKSATMHNGYTYEN